MTGMRIALSLIVSRYFKPLYRFIPAETVSPPFIQAFTGLRCLLLELKPMKPKSVYGQDSPEKSHAPLRLRPERARVEDDVSGSGFQIRSGQGLYLDLAEVDLEWQILRTKGKRLVYQSLLSTLMRRWTGAYDDS